MHAPVLEAFAPASRLSRESDTASGRGCRHMIVVAIIVALAVATVAVAGARRAQTVVPPDPDDSR